MDDLRRAAESEMRRPAPRGALGEESAKRRRVGGDEDDDGNGGGENKNENGENGDLAHPDEPQQRPWLRFAYSGASSLEGDSTLGFVVSSMIRKERSAAREATGVLCALLGVAEAEEAEEDEAEGEEGEEKEKEKEKSSVDDDEKNKQRSGPCLTPTLSPVKLGCRGLSLLVYRGKSNKNKKFEGGAAARCVDELVRRVLSAREEKKEKEKERKGGAKAAAGSDDGGEAAEAVAEAEAEAAPAAAAEAFAPLFFVRRVVPVDAAVVEEGAAAARAAAAAGGSGTSSSGKGGGAPPPPALERLSRATKGLVSRVDLRTLLGLEGKKEEISSVKFAVCYRRHAPSEQEEEEAEGAREQGKEQEKEATAAATATAAPTTTTTVAPGLACRAAVTRAVAEALAASLKDAIPPGASVSVDLKNPNLVCCVEVLPLNNGSSLVATLSLLPRRSCDGQLRVQGLSEEDCMQSERNKEKRR